MNPPDTPLREPTPGSKETSAALRLKRSLGATFFGIILNLVLAGGKTMAGVIGHSQALIADGIESLADVFSSLIVWRALVVAAAPADREHPYGHGKAEPLAAATVGAMLLFAALSIGVLSVQQIIRPHHAPAPFTLVVLIVVAVIKELLFRFVARTARDTGSTAVSSDAWHHRSDAITSGAAGIGIAVALLGGEGWESADDVAAVLASLIIAWNGWRILTPALDELMDAAGPPELVQQINTIAAAVRQVDGVEKCVVRRHGYHYYVDLHVQVDPNMTVALSHRIAHEVKDRLRTEIPRIHDVLIHIEPSGEINKHDRQ
jgi:cation diffusion facilitator family transporter